MFYNVTSLQIRTSIFKIFFFIILTKVQINLGKFVVVLQVYRL